MGVGHRFYIACGANLGDREATFRRVVAEVESRLGAVEAVSRLYRTDPLNPPELTVDSQPEFLNAAFMFRSVRAPLEVLDELLSIERLLGRERERTVRWGPRTVDLDILLVDDLVVAEPRLRVPHPEMLNRDFVLFPLADIAPQVVHPGTRQTIGAIAAAYRASGRPTFVRADG